MLNAAGANVSFLLVDRAPLAEEQVGFSLFLARCVRFFMYIFTVFPDL